MLAGTKGRATLHQCWETHAPLPWKQKQWRVAGYGCVCSGRYLLQKAMVDIKKYPDPVVLYFT